MFLQFIINGFIAGLLYALIALAFSLTYNTTKIFHIAYAGVIVASSYFFLLFQRLGLSLIILLPLVIICVGLLNLAIEKFIYQKMERKSNSHNTILVASIGVFIVIINLIAMIFGNENQSINNTISTSIHINTIIITQSQFWQLTISTLFIVLLIILLNKSNLGIKIKALGNDEVLYKVLGNDSYLLRNILFFVSGILGAIGALLISFDVGFDPYYGMPLLLNALVAMIIGGFGSYKGSVLGGILLGIIQSIAVFLFEARWETAISFVILILILIIRPQGLFGLRPRKI